jgi:hypothetical protein
MMDRKKPLQKKSTSRAKLEGKIEGLVDETGSPGFNDEKICEVIENFLR